MSPPKSTRPALLRPLCAVGALALVLAWAGWHAGDSPPAVPEVNVPDGWGVPDLLHHLEEQGLALHTVPTRRGDPRWGAYLCERERRWEELVGLPLRAERAGRWRGVVLVLPAAAPLRVPAEDVDGWGRNGLRAGPLLFFGDEALLRRIAEALARQGRSRSAAAARRP